MAGSEKCFSVKPQDLDVLWWTYRLPAVCGRKWDRDDASPCFLRSRSIGTWAVVFNFWKRLKSTCFLEDAFSNRGCVHKSFVVAAFSTCGRQVQNGRNIFYRDLISTTSHLALICINCLVAFAKRTHSRAITFPHSLCQLHRTVSYRVKQWKFSDSNNYSSHPWRKQLRNQINPSESICFRVGATRSSESDACDSSLRLLERSPKRAIDCWWVLSMFRCLIT